MIPRNLQEYTKSTKIPEPLQLSGGEFRQLFDMIREATVQVDGIFNALCLAYRAGYETALESIGKKNLLKEYRVLRGFTQDELSELTGISLTTIKTIENGFEVILNTRDIAKIAEALSADPFDIFLS